MGGGVVAKRQIPKRLRFSILERDNFTCQYLRRDDLAGFIHAVSAMLADEWDDGREYGKAVGYREAANEFANEAQIAFERGFHKGARRSDGRAKPAAELMEQIVEKQRKGGAA